MRKNYKGFTLIELLVVIAIIGLLSTLAVVALNSARQKSRDAKRVSDIKQVQTSLELFFADQNGYPNEGGTGNLTLGVAATDVLDSTGFVGTAGAGLTVYMGLVPAAPTPPAGNTYLFDAAASSGGAACTSGTACGYYTVTFVLEGNTGSLTDGSDADTIPTCTADPNGITCV